MIADLGRPYSIPSRPPYKTYTSEKNKYVLYRLNDKAVEVFEIVGESVKQRIVLTEHGLNDFEQLVKESGYEEHTPNL